MTGKDTIEALSIFIKYKPNLYIEGQHDVVFVDLDEETDDRISDEDRDRLDQLGWFWSDEGDCWSHFT